MPAQEVTLGAPVPARRWDRLAILAGGGALPVRLAEACEREGAPFAVIRLAGYADEGTARFGGPECGIAEVGKCVRLMRQAGCDALVMAGVVARPDLSALAPDWRGVALLPRVVRAARRGDGAVLDVLVEAFEAEGFLVVGADEVSGALGAGAGPLGAHAPSEADRADMAKAAAIVAALGPFDVGQGAVVRDGLVLAVEAAEGTDAMLARVAALPPPGEGQPRGVLLKRPKPGQELRVDLPTIGVRTVELAAAAGLAGVAVEAGAALVLDRDAVARAADAAGLFVHGYEAGAGAGAP